jgi:hypothetical protein
VRAGDTRRRGGTVAAAGAAWRRLGSLRLTRGRRRAPPRPTLARYGRGRRRSGSSRRRGRVRYGDRMRCGDRREGRAQPRRPPSGSRRRRRGRLLVPQGLGRKHSGCRSARLRCREQTRNPASAEQRNRKRGEPGERGDRQGDPREAKRACPSRARSREDVRGVDWCVLVFENRHVLTRRPVGRALAAGFPGFTGSLRRLEHRVRQARPRLESPVAEVEVGQARERQPRLRVNPEEGSAAAEVAEGAGRVVRTRPVR